MDESGVSRELPLLDILDSRGGREQSERTGWLFKKTIPLIYHPGPSALCLRATPPVHLSKMEGNTNTALILSLTTKAPPSPPCIH